MSAHDHSKLTSSLASAKMVAMLRAINVGGKNKLPMKTLAELFTGAGCRDVRTYIQSGNVVFFAAPDTVERISEVIRDAIRDRFGYDVPVITRSADELRQVVAGNPFVDTKADLARLYVVFLAEHPSAKAVAKLDPNRSPPDEFVVRGREIYLHCPNRLGRSKLTNAYFDSRLGTKTTVRNWNTTLKLLELATDS